MVKQLEWAKKLQAISQAGHTYSKDKFDLERFDQIQQIAFEMLSEISDEPIDKIANLLIPETGYPTPKVDVRAGVIRNNKILLHISEHSDHPFRDYTIADFAIIRSPIPRFSGHF